MDDLDTKIVFEDSYGYVDPYSAIAEARRLRHGGPSAAEFVNNRDLVRPSRVAEAAVGWAAPGASSAFVRAHTLRTLPPPRPDPVDVRLAQRVIRKAGELSAVDMIKQAVAGNVIDGMSKSGSCYVYVLCYQDLTPFYIGKGQGRRCFAHLKPLKSDTTPKDDLIRKLNSEGTPPVVFKLKVRMTARQAFMLEERLIKEIGRKPSGPLMNRTSGGGGMKGYISPDEAEWLAKMRSNADMLGQIKDDTFYESRFRPLLNKDD